MACTPFARFVCFLLFISISFAIPSALALDTSDTRTSCTHKTRADYAACVATYLYSLRPPNDTIGDYTSIIVATNCRDGLPEAELPFRERRSICKAFNIPDFNDTKAIERFKGQRDMIAPLMRGDQSHSLTSACFTAVYTGPSIDRCFTHFNELFGGLKLSFGVGDFSGVASILDSMDKTTPDFVAQVQQQQGAFIDNVKALWLLFLGNALLGIVYAANLGFKVRLLFGILSIIIFLFDSAYVQAGFVIILLITSLGASVYSPSERAGAGVAIGVTVICCFTAAMQHPMISLAVGAVAMVVIGFYVYASLATRPRVEIVLYMWGAMTVANLWVAYSRVLARAEYFDPIVAAAFYIIRASIPYTAMTKSGWNFFFLASVWEAKFTSEVVGHAWSVDKTALFVALYFGRYMLFYTFRTILGFSVVRRVQGLDWLSIAFRSFLIPIIDVFAPIHAVIALVSGRAARRSFAFEIVNSMFVVASIIYAIDLYVFHLLLALFVAIVFPNIRRTNRVLLCDDFTVTAQGFHQIGSNPWMDTAFKDTVSNAVRRVSTSVGSGVCFLQRLGSNVYLRTVAHVANEQASVTVDGATLNVSEVHRGGGDDPSVSLHVTAGDTSDMPTAEVSDLTRDEVPSVSLLWIFSPRLDFGGAETFIDNFTFDFANDCIRAAVNLTYGDSGTPVFAILKNGVMRLAGFVSRGSRDTGAGNFISTVFSAGRKRGSPGLGSDSVQRDLTVYGTRMVQMFTDLNEEIKSLVTAEREAAKTRKGGKQNGGDRKRNARRKALRDKLAITLPLATTKADELLALFDEKRIIAFNVTRAQNQSGFDFTYGVEEPASTAPNNDAA